MQDVSYRHGGTLRGGAKWEVPGSLGVLPSKGIKGIFPGPLGSSFKRIAIKGTNLAPQSLLPHLRCGHLFLDMLLPLCDATPTRG